MTAASHRPGTGLLLQLGRRRLASAEAIQFAFGLVDRPKQIVETCRIVDGPKARKAVAQQLNLALGQKSNGNDSFIGQNGAPRLTCIKRGDAAEVPTVSPVS